MSVSVYESVTAKYVCVWVYVYQRINVWMCVQVYECVYVCVYEEVRVWDSKLSVCVSTWVCMYESVWVCVYVNMYDWMSVYV